MISIDSYSFFLYTETNHNLDPITTFGGLTNHAYHIQQGDLAAALYQ